jgi:hypothetical protein
MKYIIFLTYLFILVIVAFVMSVLSAKDLKK